MTVSTVARNTEQRVIPPTTPVPLKTLHHPSPNQQARGTSARTLVSLRGGAVLASASWSDVELWDATSGRQVL